jgi:CubicO group peptidase (beta-lactamase class C family)
MDNFNETDVPKMSTGTPYEDFVVESHGLGMGVAKKRAEESENPEDEINWTNVHGTIFDGILNGIFYKLEVEKKKRKSKKAKKV